MCVPERRKSEAKSTMSQRSFARAEYALKKKQTRREKFLAEMERVVPWASLISVIEPLYPTSGRACTCCSSGINAHLLQQGLLMRAGTIVDATIIAAPSSTKNASGEHDPEMHQAKKGNQWQGPQWHISMQPGKRKLLSDSALGQMLEKVEQIKAGIRAKVEHPFHIVKNLFKHKKARYKGLAKNSAQLFSLFGLANLVIAKRQLLAMHGGGAS
jgi:IS5 family transposase